VDQGASDLIITVGSSPAIRKNGGIVRLPGQRLTPVETDGLLQQLLVEEQREAFGRYGEISLSYSVFGTGRFRVQAFRQRGTVSFTVRTIPTLVRSALSLGIPEAAVRLALCESGLVIIAGPPGSGRTTTLASMVDAINSQREAHLVTLEDPIEYLHRHNRSIVNQREIGSDCPTFADGLRGAIVQTADVIVLGEMDAQSVPLMLRAAGNRILVLTVVMASDVREALRLAKERQTLMDGPNIRKYISNLIAWIVADEAEDNAIAAYNKGDFDQAVAFLRQAMQNSDFNTPDNKQRIGDYEDRARRRREDVAATHKREERERRNRPEAERLNDEAVILLKAERADEALAKLNKALELFPDDKSISANWNIVKAYIALREADLQAAIDFNEKAVSLDPDNQAAKATLEKARSLRNAQRATIQAAFEETRQRLNSLPPAGTVVATRAADPRIVSVASLPKQAREIENSPGAPEARKAFQAVANHDWSAGLAWYQQALLKDPNNGALKRMVDLGTYTIERQRIAPYTKADWDRLDVILEQVTLEMYREDETAVRRTGGTARATASLSSEMKEFLSLLKPTLQDDSSTPGNQGTADAKSDRQTWEEMSRHMVESWAEEAGRRAAMHLLSDKRKEAVTELRDAEQMAPEVPNYRNALNALTGADEQRNFAGKNPRAYLDFITN